MFAVAPVRTLGIVACKEGSLPLAFLSAACLVLLMATSCKSTDTTFESNAQIIAYAADTQRETPPLSAEELAAMLAILSHDFLPSKTHVLSEEAKSLDQYQNGFGLSIDDAEVLRSYLTSGLKDAWNRKDKRVYPLLPSFDGDGAKLFYAYTLSMRFNKVTGDEAPQEQMLVAEWELDSEYAPDLVKTLLLLASPLKPLSEQRRFFFQGMRLKKNDEYFAHVGAIKGGAPLLSVSRCLNPGREEAPPFGSLVMFDAGGALASSAERVDASRFAIKVSEKPMDVAYARKQKPIVVGRCKDGCQLLKALQETDSAKIIVSGMSVAVKVKPFAKTRVFARANEDPCKDAASGLDLGGE